MYLLFFFFFFFLVMLGLTCCAQPFSSCSEGGYSSLQCVGFLLQGLLLLWSVDARASAP